MVVGGSGAAVNLGMVFVATSAMPVWRFESLRNWLAGLFNFPQLTNAGVRDIVVYLIGILVSIFSNFLLNNYWTWGDRVKANPGGGFAGRLGKFYLVSSVAATVQLLVSSFLSPQMRAVPLFTMRLFGDWQVYHILAPSAGILVGLVINYVANNVWTFRKKS